MIIIVSQIVNQGKNRLIQIPTKYNDDFKKFVGRDLKITLEKV